MNKSQVSKFPLNTVLIWLVFVENLTCCKHHLARLIIIIKLVIAIANCQRVQSYLYPRNQQQKHHIFVRLELKNSVILHLVLLRLTPVASNSFSFPSLRSSYTAATLSSTCFWIFLPSRIQSGEETDVGRQRLNHSSLSLSRFSELNKALDTNEYNWWRVFIFLPQELQTRSHLSSARNILFARITSNEPVCFEGWNKFSVPIWSPWEPNLTHRRSGCQLGLLSINFDFRNVIFQPMVFPFVWAKYKWNFMRDRCKLSFPLPLTASPLARAFSRDLLHSPK